MENQEIELVAGDRVQRVERPGQLGTVERVRVETTRTTLKEDGGEPPGITVTVLWDNGTLSHFVPKSLQKA